MARGKKGTGAIKPLLVKKVAENLYVAPTPDVAKDFSTQHIDPDLTAEVNEILEPSIVGNTVTVEVNEITGVFCGNPVTSGPVGINLMAVVDEMLGSEELQKISSATEVPPFTDWEQPMNAVPDTDFKPVPPVQESVYVRTKKLGAMVDFHQKIRIEQGVPTLVLDTNWIKRQVKAGLLEYVKAD